MPSVVVHDRRVLRAGRARVDGIRGRRRGAAGEGRSLGLQLVEAEALLGERHLQVSLVYSKIVWPRKRGYFAWSAVERASISPRYVPWSAASPPAFGWTPLLPSKLIPNSVSRSAIWLVFTKSSAKKPWMKSWS